MLIWNMGFWMAVALWLAHGGVRIYVRESIALWRGRIAAHSWAGGYWETPPPPSQVIWGWTFLALLGLSLDPGFSVSMTFFVVWLVVCAIVAIASKGVNFALRVAGGGGGSTVTPQEAKRLQSALSHTYHATIGVATGALKARSDPYAAPAGMTMFLDRDGITMHTLIFGATGTGKTSAWALPMSYETMVGGGGLLSVESKWGDAQDMFRAAVAAGKEVHLVGVRDGHQVIGRLNLFARMTPSMLGSVTKDQLGKSPSTFWIDAPASLGSMWAGLAAGLDGETVDVPATGVMPAHQLEVHYNPACMRRLLYSSNEALAALLERAAEVRDRLMDSTSLADRRRLDVLSEAMYSFSVEYPRMLESSGSGSNVLGNILTTLRPAYATLTADSAIREAFSADESDFDLEGVLSAGHVVIVYLDHQRYQDATRFVLAALLRRVQALAAGRENDMSVTPISVVINELGSIASDDFGVLIEKVRAGSVGIIACAQSIPGVARACGEKTAMSIFGNFGTVICAGTNDPETMRYMTDIISTVEKNVASFNMSLRGSHGMNVANQTRQILTSEIWGSLGVLGNGTARGLAIAKTPSGVLHDVVVQAQFPRA